MNENTAFINDYSREYIPDSKINLMRIKANEAVKKYSYKEFKEFVNIVGHLSFRVIYFFYGFLQFFVTWSALVKILHNDNIIIRLVSFALGFLPVIGTGVGVFGANICWGWSLLHSILIFFIIPYSIVNGPLLMIGFYDIYRDWRRWNTIEENT